MDIKDREEQLSADARKEKIEALLDAYELSNEVAIELPNHSLGWELVIDTAINEKIVRLQIDCDPRIAQMIVNAIDESVPEYPPVAGEDLFIDYVCLSERLKAGFLELAKKYNSKS